MQHPDCCIAGAGIIGLSLALELHRRGAAVTVLDQASPLAESSTAAAGMLAATDPDNPPQLLPLSNLSLALYSNYLAYIESLSGLPIPFQTTLTLQASHTRTSSPDATALLPQLIPGAHHFIALNETSIDPRQLAHSLLAAVRTTSIRLCTHTALQNVRSESSAVQIQTSSGIHHTANFIDCTGAWAASLSPLSPPAVFPRKGQMLSVALPPSLPLHMVVRTPDIYIVPRTLGPNAGRAIIGATIEDQDFDKTVHPAAIARLQASAAQLLPSLTSAPILETWAGLRPATADGLPLIGPLPRHANHYLATGHFRNGILLAPVTALLLAQLLSGEAPSIDLSPFSPSRLLS